MTTNHLGLPRDLGDGLVLRWATADDAEQLLVRSKKLYGGAIPSGNAAALPPMAVTLGMRDILAARRLRLYCQGGAWQRTVLRIALLGKMDVIFCRNVIIYFDQVGKKKAIESFFQRLDPEGFLLLGHSESLVNLSTSFQLRHFKHDMVYQKPMQTSLLSGGLL